MIIIKPHVRLSVQLRILSIRTLSDMNFMVFFGVPILKHSKARVEASSYMDMVILNRIVHFCENRTPRIFALSMKLVLGTLDQQ